MPNNRKKNNKVETSHPKKAKGEKSKQVFKSRLLTLCCKERKVDKDDQWYYIPTVTLAGQWLYDAGFRSEQQIELVVENRRIIMRVESEPYDYPSKEQLTLQINRLEKQLRQIPDEMEIKQPGQAHGMKRNISQHKAVFVE